MMKSSRVTTAVSAATVDRLEKTLETAVRKVQRHEL